MPILIRVGVHEYHDVINRGLNLFLLPFKGVRVDTFLKTVLQWRRSQMYTPFARSVHIATNMPETYLVPLQRRVRVHSLLPMKAKGLVKLEMAISSDYRSYRFGKTICVK